MKKTILYVLAASVGISVTGMENCEASRGKIPKTYIDYEYLQPEKWVIKVSEEDIELMARVVMSEGSLLSIEGKQAIAETIINRVLSDQFPNTVKEVVYMPNAYSIADNGEPTTECLDAVLTALEFHAYPETMFYFRTDYYHDFAYPYMQIGNTYFSTEEDLRILE